MLADGRVATCTDNQTIIETDGISETHNNGDLFWAFRGGGGGSFGIVVNYVLKLLPGPTSIVYARFIMNYNHDDDVKAFLEANDAWQRTAPFYWGNYVNFRNRQTIVVVNDTHNVTYQHRIFTTLYKLGPWDKNIESELQPFYDLKTHRTLADVSIKIANYSSYSQSLPRHTTPSRGIKVGAYVPTEKINATLWDFLVADTTAPSEGAKQCTLRRFGGKIFLRPKFKKQLFFSMQLHVGF